MHWRDLGLVSAVVWPREVWVTRGQRVARNGLRMKVEVGRLVVVEARERSGLCTLARHLRESGA